MYASGNPEPIVSVLHRWHSLHTNARLEGFKDLFQAAKARARGYRNVESFINMVN